MRKFAVSLFSVIASAVVACGGGDDDPRTAASQYAVDPIKCVQDSDCCVVNDGCHSTAYLIASKDSAQVSSLIASSDNTTCNRCLTPMLQVSCVSGACVGERIVRACMLSMPYPGNHCGKLELPPSCVSSTSSDDAGIQSPEGGTLKPLGVFACGT